MCKNLASIFLTRFWTSIDAPSIDKIASIKSNFEITRNNKEDFNSCSGNKQ